MPEHAHILIVEDNEINQLVVTGMLDNLGCTYDIANDGSTALDLASSGTYSIILMDCHMPVMDGFEVTRRIRDQEQKQQCPRHPIIAITAGNLEDEKQNCMDAGMDDYLGKPLTQDTLNDMLTKWLSSASPDTPAPASQLL